MPSRCPPRSWDMCPPPHGTCPRGTARAAATPPPPRLLRPARAPVRPCSADAFCFALLCFAFVCFVNFFDTRQDVTDVLDRVDETLGRTLTLFYKKRNNSEGTVHYVTNDSRTTTGTPRASKSKYKIILSYYYSFNRFRAYRYH